jgi:HemY protein
VIRLASWIVGSLVVSALIAWLIALPGTLTIDVGGQRIQPRLGTAIFMILATLFVAGVIWTIVTRLLATPGRLARSARERRRQAGIDALSDGFIALEAGDPQKARALAREAQSKLSDSPAAQLLEARADLAAGDMGAAREHYRALISNEKTALAALSGLYEQARAQRRPDAALTFARKALTLEPTTGWASQAVFDDLVRQRAWSQAVAMLNEHPASGREQKAVKRRKQAVIETARAREGETTNPLAALDHALTALKLLPDFVPAALIAARIQSSRGEVRRALSLLRRVYRATSHPHVALLYAHAQPGASAADRLKRVRELIEMPPPDRASALVLARAAIDAYDWSMARTILEPYLDDPTEGVASLMADLEEGETADHGKARAWLARAVRAPRDPIWTADGITSPEWEPVSPVTGKLDAFEWKVPLSAVASAIAEPPPAPSLPASPASDVPEAEAEERPLLEGTASPAR